MQNRSQKKLTLSFLALINSWLLSMPFAYAEGRFVDSECFLPYLRIDFGQARFFPVKGYDIRTRSNTKLQSKDHSVIAAGLGLGISFGDKFRSDITWFHHLNPVLQGGNDRNVIKRKPLIDAYFFNAYYEIASKISIFNPYIGAGIGLARINDNFISIRPVRESHKVPVKNNLAYRFMLGSSFDVNESIKFDLAYNYHDYGRAKSRLDNNKNEIGKSHYRAHIVSLGLRFGM